MWLGGAFLRCCVLGVLCGARLSLGLGFVVGGADPHERGEAVVVSVPGVVQFSAGGGAAFAAVVSPFADAAGSSSGLASEVLPVGGELVLAVAGVPGHDFL